MTSWKSGIHVPVRVRQFPRFILDAFRRAFVLSWPKSRSRARTFRLCYFSCTSHFPYLYCSIHSLSRIRTACELDLLVFCDRDEPFSNEQAASLAALGLPLRIVPWPKAHGWGTPQIAAIWEAYALAAKDAPEDGFVACVDSDVFFFSGWLFDLVSKTSAGLVGDGHFVDFKYCQGGVYFFSVAGVRRVLEVTPVSEFEREFNRASVVVEDVAAYHLARRARLRIWLSFFMMFPDEYKNAGRLTRYQRAKFACLHYTLRDKREMFRIYCEEMVPANEKHEFLNAVGVHSYFGSERDFVSRG